MLHSPPSTHTYTHSLLQINSLSPEGNLTLCSINEQPTMLYLKKQMEDGELSRHSQPEDALYINPTPHRSTASAQLHSREVGHQRPQGQQETAKSKV